MSDYLMAADSGKYRISCGQKKRLSAAVKMLQTVFVFLFLAVAFLNAETVTPELVRKAGENWLRHADHFTTYKDGRVYHVSEATGAFFPIINENNEPVAYCLQLDPTGYIILSGDDRLNPIIAYSKESRFYSADTQANTLLQMIRTDLTLRLRALAENRISQDKLVNNGEKWSAILQDNFGKAQEKGVADISGPFLSSMWGQGKVNGENVFNLFTPNNWSTGCVATAMAQILHYYRWPVKGIGSHIYNEDDAGVIEVNFGATQYDWQNMLDVYTDVAATQAQKEAVSLLGFHCGVSVEMDYEYTGSTASTRDVPAALSRYFCYAGEYIENGSAEFFPQLKNEMLLQHPAQIAVATTSGYGHSVVVDGYADFNGYYHLNMGWLGENNGWYDLEAAFNAGGYSIVDGAVIKFCPLPVFADAYSLTTDSLTIFWRTSFRINPDGFELQYSEDDADTWNSLSSAIRDTFYTVNVNDLLGSESTTGTIYLRVRAFSDSVWGEWSPEKAIKVRPDRKITFRVNMSEHALNERDTVVVRGNIPPLSAYQNSVAFAGPDSDGVYAATIAFDYSQIDQLLIYRFAVISGDSVAMESVNREYRIKSDEYQVLPVVWFDEFGTGTEPVAGSDGILRRFSIANYPNPFNAATTLRYSLPQSGIVDIELYDLTGRFLGYIMRNQYQQSGYHRTLLNFDTMFLKNGRRSPASGTYFVVLKAADTRHYHKILYMK